MNGILLINKPQGFTSFDVIAKLRGILKIKRLGHAGTLDPMATGVLPVFVGKATRACDIIPNNEKIYTADFKLGVVTDTQDSTGTIIQTFEKKVTKAEILDVLDNFRGEIDQLPPMYSAVSVNGQRLYDLARQGIEVERKSRKITINSIELLDFNEDNQTGKLVINCSKGTYIRTIIHDIGQALSTGGIMTGLVRNSSSGFDLENCLTLEQVEELKKSDKLESVIIPIDKAFESYDKIRLNEIQSRMYKNGVKLDLNRIKYSKDFEIFRIYDNNNGFLGIAKADKNTSELKCHKNFFDN